VHPPAATETTPRPAPQPTTGAPTSAS
jgi:hypothetical protein